MWLHTFYNCVWSVAANLTLFATITSIIMLLAIGQTSLASEAVHFVKVLEISTHGLGPMFAIGCLYVSVLIGGLLFTISVMRLLI